MLYTTIGYFLLIFFDLAFYSFDQNEFFLASLLKDLDLLKSDIIFSALEY